MRDACGLDQVDAVEVVRSGCILDVLQKSSPNGLIVGVRERVKDGSKV